MSEDSARSESEDQHDEPETFEDKLDETLAGRLPDREMVTPAEARMRKLEDRNTDLRHALDDVAQDLEEAIEIGTMPRDQLEETLEKLEPFRFGDGDA